MATSLEVDGDDGVRILGEIGVQDFESDVVVVELVVAESHIHVEGVVFSVVNEEALIDFSCIFEVVSEI